MAKFQPVSLFLVGFLIFFIFFFFFKNMTRGSSLPGQRLRMSYIVISFQLSCILGPLSVHSYPDFQTTFTLMSLRQFLSDFMWSLHGSGNETLQQWCLYPKPRILWCGILAYIIGNVRSTKIAKIMNFLH